MIRSGSKAERGGAKCSFGNAFEAVLKVCGMESQCPVPQLARSLNI